MNILDWCVLAFLAASVLLGVLRGGVKEVLGLGGWIGGLVFALLGAPLIAPLLQDLISSPNMRWIAAFILIFISIRLLAWGLGKLLAEIIAAAKLGVFDKFIGALFGVFRAIVITLVITFLCMMTRMPGTPMWQSSTSAPIFQNLVIALTPFLPADAQRWIKS
jgi:membrane protein required for colicin V production